MRPKLLKSFIIVVLFWMTVTTLYWSVQQPSVNFEALVALKALIPFLPLDLAQYKPTIMGSLVVQLKVLAYWSLPMLVLTAISGLMGYGFIWRKAHQTSDARSYREKGKGDFRGVNLTLGELPMPAMLPRDEIDLGSDDNEALSRLTESERRLLCDVLGTISAADDPYAGPGITIPLMDHTVNLVAKSLTHPKYPGLSSVVAASHELGKLTAYRRNENNEWVAFKNHDREAARILGTLDSWYTLPTLERNAVLMAVKFHSTPRAIPDLNGDPNVYRLARELLTIADDAQVEAVTEEKQRTLEQTELPDVLFEAFAKALPSLSFQNRGLPKGVAAVAWKIGNRVYLLEIKLRETVMAKLPADVRGALTPSTKERQRLQPFTTELLKALDQRGWLVKRIGDATVEGKEALWNIKAGKLDFKGVIVIDVPAEFMPMLPADDSMYEITVMGPLFNQPAAQAHGGAGGMGMSRDDLLGSVLRAAPKNAGE